MALVLRVYTPGSWQCLFLWHPYSSYGDLYHSILKYSTEIWVDKTLCGYIECYLETYSNYFTDWEVMYP
jgi:hypothetical protein